MSTEIFRCVAGSRLFCTATDASDTDYKAVHIPSARDILLGRTVNVRDTSTGDKNTHNSAQDVDKVSFSLQKFTELLAKGETNALEMLHTPNEHDDWAWNMLVDNKFRVIPANMKAFVGFGRSQAMRYAVRGDRVTVLKALVDFLQSVKDRCGNTRLNRVTAAMVDIEALDGVKIVPKQHGGTTVDYIVAFGRAVPVNCKVGEIIDVFQKPLDQAGKRSRDAVDGPDWKGLYHAHRIVDEGIELFTTGSLVFPCKNAAEYLQIRNGELSIERVLDTFDEKLATLENVKPISDFREKADKEWIDEFVASFHEQRVIDAYNAWQNA